MYLRLLYCPVGYYCTVHAFKYLSCPNIQKCQDKLNRLCFCYLPDDDILQKYSTKIKQTISSFKL